jgi:hypothetical protein
VHLCDGSGSLEEGRVFDEHLLPGRGSEPVAEVLQLLARANWDGAIVAEVNTRKTRSETEQLGLLVETLAFARLHTKPPRGRRSQVRTNAPGDSTGNREHPGTVGAGGPHA